MHGIVFVELKAYVESRLGADAWKSLLDDQGLGHRIYLATQPYPDEELFRLVAGIASRLGSTTSAVLKDAGKFILPDLVTVYAAYIRPEWGPLDLLERIETTVHRAVRAQSPGASPPPLQCDRVGADEVAITYSSPRKLCEFGEGLILGVADWWRASLHVSQQTCMLRGDDRCYIRIVQLKS